MLRKYKLYLLGIKIDSYYEDIFYKLDYIFSKSFTKRIDIRTYLCIKIGSYDYEYVEIAESFLHFSDKYYNTIFGNDFRNDKFILYYFNTKLNTKCLYLNISFVPDVYYILKNQTINE